MKNTILFLAAMLVLFTGCNKYDDDIAAIEDRLDKIEGSLLTTIDQQITNINGSIDNLKAVDAELNGYIESLQTAAADLQSQIDNTNTALAALESDLEAQISASEQKVLSELNTVKTALETQLATINNTIVALQAKDEELDQKIADLKTYVDSKITATEDWATATFSTLEQYEETQTAISEINALIKSTQESIADLEEKLNKKIADDIAAAVASVNSDIAAKVTEITNGYTTAIANATDAITAAYTDAIKTAITASETSMKEWVNGVLADGYYQKAEIDGKITALQTQVAEGDAALQKEIDDLEAALAKAESDLNDAYEKAIADAVADGGIINAAIAAAVNTAKDTLQAQIDAITGEISEIENRLANVESQIAALIDQIQSLTYIPTHTDGKATMAYNATLGKWETELSFFVTPKSVVGNIKQEHISAKGVYTAATRAVDLIDLSVTAFESDAANGTITVTVSGDNLTDFQSGMSDAAVFLIISDGNSEFVSDYVPLVLKNPGNINAANMSADDLKTTVSQALNGGVRDFTITGNLTEEQQKAVGTALRDWCGIKGRNIYNEAGQGTVSLTLPDVTEIFERTFGEIVLDGDNGVMQCSYALKSVNLPKVSVIGEDAFNFQRYLQSVTAPKVVEVKDSGFGSCEALTQVNMPNVKKVENFSFAYTSLADFPFSNLQEIGNYAFDDNRGELTSVTLSNATSIGNGAFRYGSKLERVTAPQLTVIPLWAFSDCKNLTTLSLGSPITEWGNQVLNNVPTENITLYLHKDQKALSDDDSNAVWTIADGASGVEFGTGKTFCGYTFKEIKKYGE